MEIELREMLKTGFYFPAYVEVSHTNAPYMSQFERFLNDLHLNMKRWQEKR